MPHIVVISQIVRWPLTGDVAWSAHSVCLPTLFQPVTCITCIYCFIVFMNKVSGASVSAGHSLIRMSLAELTAAFRANTSPEVQAVQLTTAGLSPYD